MSGNERTVSGESFPTAPKSVLVWALTRKQLLLLIRYPADTVSRLITAYLFFVILFYGGREAVSRLGSSPAAMAPTFDGLIIGWFLWIMAIVAYFDLARSISNESQWGTLEQLYMTPYGFGLVMCAKAAANLLVSVVVGGIILLLMLLTTGRNLTVDLVTVLPIVGLSLLSVLGLGFAVAGAAVVVKRVTNVMQLAQFALIGLIAAPAAEYSLFRALPLVQGSDMLQRAMREGIRLWEFTPGELGLLVATAVVYFTGGYLVLRQCTRHAKRKGILGDY